MPFRAGRGPQGRAEPGLQARNHARRRRSQMTEITEKLKVAIADRYVIEQEVGQGGMATVYLAHDVKHDRKVALKVLRPELAAVIGAERFLQEIKVTANLQHSHILPLYDSGAAEGFLYYVMPYVEGETLRTRIDREKQLGVDDAVALARAVAAALEYAHKQGVVHRDIKPENILLRDDDPLIADFGIALAVSHAGGNRLTETGLSIGTPHYMSPEQAMGDRELDARSDVYSLAAVVYEMLTGDPPYSGSTAQAIVARVITEEPRSITAQRRTVPPHVADAVHKALHKLPADRFGSAASFAEALVTPGYVTPSPTRAGMTAATDARRAPILTVVSVTAALIFAGLAAWGWLRGAPAAVVARFDIGVVGSPGPATVANGASLAIAPDGSHFVYVATDGGLYDRDLGQLESRSLPARGFAPFFSPDGEWIGYADRGALKKVAPTGGPPLAIATVNFDLFRGASWGEDGAIVFAPDVNSPLLLVPDGGGPIDTLTHLDGARGVTSHRWPEWLPGQHGVLFQACSGSADQCEIAALDLRTDSVHYLVPGTSPHYISTGHLLYTSPSGSLLAAPFDPDRMELTGNPVSLMEGILMRASWNGDFAISRNGTLVYLSGQAGGGDLTLLDSTGNARALLPDLVDAQAPRFSPDGRRVAFTAAPEGPSEVWIFDRTLETVSRLTFEGNALYPTWTARGDTVYYSTDADSPDRDIWRRAADGSGVPERVLARPGDQYEIALPVTGGIALVREIPTTGSGLDLYALPLAPAGDLRPWVVSSFSERSPSLSPDARWAAYASNESGADEIYVRAFPEAQGRWQVSSGGGTEPLWSSDGRTIYYRRADTLFATAVQTGLTFVVGQRRTVFTTSFRQITNHANYDRDGRTGELVTIDQTEENASSLVVVLNWFEELRRRMGGAR
jgi:tRNA A-37 threonylcarbamoyl transferase component Bud32